MLGIEPGLSACLASTVLLIASQIHFLKTKTKDIFIRYFLHLHFKCYPESPLYHPPALYPYPPTPAFWPWHSPELGHMIFAIPSASPPIDGRLCHLLLQMQLETQALGILVSSYCCSTYRVADPFSSLGTFSSTSLGALCSIQ